MQIILVFEEIRKTGKGEIFEKNPTLVSSFIMKNGEKQVGACLMLSRWLYCETTTLRSIPSVPRQEGDAHPYIHSLGD